MSSIKLGADSGGGTVALKGPASTTGNANVELKLPVADGSANQVLATNGSGQLQWATDSTNTNASNLSSGTLPAARIADDSIVEAKLDIHAAPSGTDKFLGYTANGMEWAVPSGQGKVIKVHHLKGTSVAWESSAGADWTETTLKTGNFTPASTNSKFAVHCNTIFYGTSTNAFVEVRATKDDGSNWTTLNHWYVCNSGAINSYGYMPVSMYGLYEPSTTSNVRFSIWADTDGGGNDYVGVGKRRDDGYGSYGSHWLIYEHEA